MVRAKFLRHTHLGQAWRGRPMKGPGSYGCPFPLRDWHTEIKADDFNKGVVRCWLGLPAPTALPTTDGASICGCSGDMRDHDDRQRPAGPPAVVGRAVLARSRSSAPMASRYRPLPPKGHHCPTSARISLGRSGGFSSSTVIF